MFPKIIRNPYRNGLSGPEFPLEDGIYVKIDKRTAFRLLKRRFAVSISTSRGYCFFEVKPVYINHKEEFIWSEFCAFLTSYHVYNCDPFRGKRITYWFNLGNLSYSDELDLILEFSDMKYANYSTILKWYNKYTPKGD